MTTWTFSVSNPLYAILWSIHSIDTFTTKIGQTFCSAKIFELVSNKHHKNFLKKISDVLANNHDIHCNVNH